MNELQIFQNEEFGEIRTFEEDGKVLFCASDVAKALGYARPNDAVTAHCRATVKQVPLSAANYRTSTLSLKAMCTALSHTASSRLLKSLNHGYSTKSSPQSAKQVGISPEKRT